MKTGRLPVGGTVSIKTKTNGQPVAHVMQVSPNSVSSGDHFTIYPHGMTVTHMDALCHFSWNDQFYNGRKRSQTLSTAGATWGSIYAQRQGIFTRGVLLDVAAARGVPWYKTDEYVTVADFEAAEKGSAARRTRRRPVRRTGMERMEAGQASRTPTRGQDCTPSAEWMHKRQASVRRRLHRKTAYPSESFTSPIHMIVLASMACPFWTGRR